MRARLAQVAPHLIRAGDVEMKMKEAAEAYLGKEVTHAHAQRQVRPLV